MVKFLLPGSWLILSTPTSLLNSTVMGLGDEMEASLMPLKERNRERAAATWSNDGLSAKRIKIELAEEIREENVVSIYFATDTITSPIAKSNWGSNKIPNSSPGFTSITSCFAFLRDSVFILPTSFPPLSR